MKRTLFFLLLISQSYANTYHLCGSDEDGCYDYPSCACIPYPESEINKTFCLDLDKLSCEPFSETLGCYPLFLFKNKAECLATLFQSTSHPPCKEVLEDFCLQHHIVFCNTNGQFSSCK